MEATAANELTKALILLGIGVAGLSALLFRMIAKIRGSFNQYLKAILIYILLTFIAFAAIACPAYWSASNDLFIFYNVFQLCFLLLGASHVYCMQKYLKWGGDSKATGLEFAFTIIAGITGSIGFIMGYHYFNKDGFQYPMITSTIGFLIPWFVDQIFKKTLEIPPKIFKEWFYPINDEIIEPDENKFKNLLVISFEFQKNFEETHYTNFKCKAPVDMELGKLFYYLINDYNDRHTNDSIAYTDADGDPHGWIFYKKPTWYTLITRYVHPGKTVFNNKIRENDIIICSRMIN